MYPLINQFSLMLIFQITNLMFYFRFVRSLVIIFVFNKQFESVHGLGTIAVYNFSILGALQAEKLTKRSGTCFAGHPVVYIKNWPNVCL